MVTKKIEKVKLEVRKIDKVVEIVENYNFFLKDKNFLKQMEQLCLQDGSASSYVVRVLCSSQKHLRKPSGSVFD